MAVGFSNTNKPINPRGLDASPKGYNRAALYSGKALDFDGVNDKITIPNNASLNFGTGDFSIAFVMKSSVAGFDRLLDKRDGTSGYTINVGPSKEIVLELNNGTGSSQFSTSTIYADGELKHVVIAFNRSGNADFYINGAFDESVDISSKSGDLDSTSDLFIGADAPSGTSIFYDGELSGVKIFNTALTAAQVSDLYNNPEKIVPTGVSNTALKLWLPMMEGAGTTAYDGSGNGNHGTISGATYVNGVGSPVAQSAVMDWNKGSNLVSYSEEFDDSAWQKRSAIVTADDTTAPDGSATAEKVSFSATGSAKVEQYVTGQNQSKTFTVSVWAKVASGTEEFLLKCTQAAVSDHFSDTLTVTTDWQRFTFTQTFSASSSTSTIVGVVNDTDAEARDIYFWGFQLEEASTAGPYVRTGATAQPNPVLLPQGLTSGRDITGVNLFENVRKQGALNLDGNSWAEVHDNGSLDITTAISVECWAYNPAGLSAKGLVTMYDATNGERCWMLYKSSPTVLQFYVSQTGATTDYISASNVPTDEMVHVVGVYDGSNIYIYINGSLSNSKATVIASLKTSNDPLEIGRYNYASGSELPGAIAQPRIYNRALTAEEVLRNYNSGKSTYQ